MSLTTTAPLANSSLVEVQCHFCELERHEDTLLSDVSGSVVPSVGSMVPGWTLVFPSEHVYSLADLGDDAWSGFSALVESAKRLVEQAFGPTVMFEHGSAGGGRTAACGVNHAHMHIVPIDVDLRKEIANTANEVGSFEWDRSGIRVTPVDDHDYIFISDRTGSWVTRSKSLQSQVVRRALARYLNLQEWDWKRDPRESTVLETRARLLAG
jgi:ATP adenylyltransferase